MSQNTNLGLRNQPNQYDPVQRLRKEECGKLPLCYAEKTRYDDGDIINMLGSLPDSWKLLRINFWHEVRECAQYGTDLNVMYVYTGVVARWHWLELCNDEMFCFYLLCTKGDHKSNVRRMLQQYGQQTYEEILATNPRCFGQEQSQINMMRLKLDATKRMEDITHGETSKNVNIRSENKNTTTSVSATFSHIQSIASPDQLREQIETIEQELKKISQKNIDKKAQPIIEVGLPQEFKYRNNINHVQNDNDEKESKED